MAVSYLTQKKFNEFLQEEKTHHEKQEKDVLAIRKTLYGNGVPGMDEVVRGIDLWVKKQEAKQEEEQKERNHARRTLSFQLLAVVLTQIILFVLGKILV